MAKSRDTDRLFLSLTIILVVIGFFIFISASLGLYATDAVSLGAVLRQLLLGVVGGLLLLWLFSHIHYKHWRRFALPIFLGGLALSTLVFIPGLGYSHGGAARWIDIGLLSFQPAEFLKIGFIIYCAAWCAHVGSKIKTFAYGVLPLGIMLAVVGVVLLLQPDTGSFLVIAITAGAIFIAAGAKWLHILGIGAASATGLGLLAWTRPYIQERLLTFLNPTSDPFGAGYQIQQSLIAIGSGKWLGRGMGQSIQKFNFLPEPVSDSIFAVFAEEWGFIGAVILIGLFIALILRGYKIAADSPNKFSSLLTIGLVTLIGVQVFVNISAMLGIIPLTGLPLTFISHGGTALITALASVGIILNVSRYS